MASSTGSVKVYDYEDLSKLAASAKSFQKQKYLLKTYFPRYIFANRNRHPIVLRELLMTSDSFYSSSHFLNAYQVVKELIYPRIKTLTSDKFLIATDATANIGADAITLTLFFDRVNMIELNQVTCDVLKNNLEVYHQAVKQYPQLIRKYRPEVIRCQDYTKVYLSLKQHLVYIDAPWGGPGYKNIRSLDLYLSSINVLKIASDLLSKKKALLVVLKVPFNFNFNSRYLDKVKYEVHDIINGRKILYKIVLLTL